MNKPRMRQRHRPGRDCHLINISGGKDSTACALLAMDWLHPDTKKVFVFADTGHEHPLTYKYIDYLRRRFNTQIVVAAADFNDKFEARRESIQKRWAKEGIPQKDIDRAVANLKPSGNRFIDVNMLRGGFASPTRRFCTDKLKRMPIQQQIIDPLLADGWRVIQWTGTRRDESNARANTPLYRKDRKKKQVLSFYPIRHWTADQVFEFIASKKVKRNPLYDLGLKRVGCNPCIMSSKKELATLAGHFPEAIDGVRKMEALVSGVSKRKQASFFTAKEKKDKEILKNNDLPMFKELQKFKHGTPMYIDKVVEWAHNDPRWDADNKEWVDARQAEYDEFNERQEDLFEVLLHDGCDEPEGYCG